MIPSHTAFHFAQLSPEHTALRRWDFPLNVVSALETEVIGGRFDSES